MPPQFRDPERPAETDDSYSPPVPRSILSRHGARVLDPTTRAVAVAPGVDAPLPTVYRANSLLVPKDVLRRLGDINNVLAEIGLELLPPSGQGLTDLPRPATLTVKRDGQPGTVDAWGALQHLRASPIKTIAQKITMEHLLFGADVMWSGVEGVPSPSSPPPIKGTAAAASSYIRSRDGGRLPVVLFTAKPPRRREQMIRRPVVAVLDSGISPHPWFGKPIPATGGDSFVTVDPNLQAALSNNSGFQPNDLQHFDEQTVIPDSLTGELDSHWGHGTFVTGIIRQAAPEAQVFAIRLMYSDGVAHEGDILYALKVIADRVSDAQENNDFDQMIDIVSLSLGYYSEEDTSPESQAVTPLIHKLLGMGVLVCAAAGNGSTTRPFYPAALADVPDDIQNRVISVGSLNPNRSKALFSNDGPWVRFWAPGASVVSTFPPSKNGSLGPDHTIVDASNGWRRDALDDDDFSSGFAVWTGTSFAAPMVAAKLAETMLELFWSDEGLEHDVTSQRTKKRATDTLNAVVKGVNNYVWPE